MNCQEVVEYMHRYLDQDLDPEETAEMYRHIAVCPACAEKFNVLKSLSRDLEELPAVTPPFSLVDAILPQLEAIDRARSEHNVEDMKIQPAVMVPELKRNGRRSNWFSTIAGRTVVGTVAAAMILGVAIFKYEPEMLSDAEVPFKEASMPVSNGSNGSQELPDMSEEMKKSAVSEIDPLGDDSQKPLMASEEPVEPDSGQPKSDGQKSDEPVADEPASLKQVAPNPAAIPPKDEVSDKSRMSKEPSTSFTDKGSTKNNSSTGNSVPPQKTQDNPVPPSQEMQEGSKNTAEAQDNQKADETNIASTDDSELEAGKMDLYGISSMKPRQWASPDGLYSASLTINKLVLYRLPVAADQSPEALVSIPLDGEWQAGEWSADSKVFTYTVLVDETVIKHEFHVDQPIEQGKPDANQSHGTDQKPDVNP